MEKVIRVDDLIHKRLNHLKIDFGYSNLNQVINYLLMRCGCENETNYEKEEEILDVDSNNG